MIQYQCDNSKHSKKEEFNMMMPYIPDLTERFPEGFDGIDLTDKYFPCECGTDDVSRFLDYNADEEEEDFILEEVRL